jgi:hypothetical protein
MRSACASPAAALADRHLPPPRPTPLSHPPQQTKAELEAAKEAAAQLEAKLGSASKRLGSLEGEAGERERRLKAQLAEQHAEAFKKQDALQQEVRACSRAGMAAWRAGWLLAGLLPQLPGAGCLRRCRTASSPTPPLTSAPCPRPAQVLSLSKQLAELRHSEQSEVDSWRERCEKAGEELAHLRDKTRVLLEEKEEQIERLRLQLRQRGGGALSAPSSLRDMSAAAAAAAASPGLSGGLPPLPERGGGRPGSGPSSPSRLASASSKALFADGSGSPTAAPAAAAAAAAGPGPASPEALPDLPLSTIRPGGLEETPGNSHDGADGMALGALRHRLRMLETQVRCCRAAGRQGPGWEGAALAAAARLGLSPTPHRTAPRRTTPHHTTPHHTHTTHHTTNRCPRRWSTSGARGRIRSARTRCATRPTARSRTRSRRCRAPPAWSTQTSCTCARSSSRALSRASCQTTGVCSRCGPGGRLRMVRLLGPGSWRPGAELLLLLLLRGRLLAGWILQPGPRRRPQPSLHPLPAPPAPQVLVRLLSISPPEVERIQAGAAKARARAQRSAVSLANMAQVGTSAVELLGGAVGSLKNLGAASAGVLQAQLQQLQGGAPSSPPPAIAGQGQQQQQVSPS